MRLPATRLVPLDCGVSGSEAGYCRALALGWTSALLCVAAHACQPAADGLAAAAGEDGRPIDQARPVLLASLGGESSDTAVVHRDRAAWLAALASGVSEPPTERISVTRKTWEDKVPESSVRKAAAWSCENLKTGKTGAFRDR